MRQGIEVLLLVGMVFVLVRATGLIVRSLRYLAEAGHLGKFGVTALVLALATSLPELVVGVAAALEGDSSMALGNVLGSNVADLSLVIGGATVIGGGLKIRGRFLKRNLLLSFLAGSLPLLMLLDGRLTRLDGGVLLIVYWVYLVTVLEEESGAMEQEEFSWKKRLFYFLHKDGVGKEMWRLGLGVGLLLASSHLVIGLAERVAVGLGLPLMLIGLVIVALGTSLPELVFELKAIREGEVGMVFGDLLGSVVANSTLVMGIVGLIGPFELPSSGVATYLRGTIGFIVLFGLVWLFAMSKRRLSRWEGVILVLSYLGFVMLELR